MSHESADIAFEPYGLSWRQLRKICTLELSSAKRVQSFRHIKEEEVFNLVKWVPFNAVSPIDLTQGLFSTSYGITSIVAFGKKCNEEEEEEEEEQIISVVAKATRLSAGFEVGDMFPLSKWLLVISW
ncbi:cytochrome P450 71D8-like [Eucalyptus grandis]|uniref:cytochrome P450 71D8-like n=1 Tax=Eucalyptus grandis TaxID=71139 RepID=UPI00192EBCEB|nr:cytochrome P450 71D8-like [Eucalyptus grandis]